MNEKNKTPKLYTAREIAQILNVNKKYVYILCRRKEIPYKDISIGKNPIYRFEIEKVLDYLEKKNGVNLDGCERK